MDRQEMIMIIKSIRDEFHSLLQAHAGGCEHKWQTLQVVDRLLEQLEGKIAPIPDGEISVVDTLLKLTVKQAEEIGKFRAAHAFLDSKHPFVGYRVPLFEDQVPNPSPKELRQLGCDYWLMANLLRKEQHGNHEQTGVPGSSGNSDKAGPVHQG